MTRLDRSLTFSSGPHGRTAHRASPAHLNIALLPAVPVTATLPLEGDIAWHTAPNSHANGGLKNAVDSVKERLTRKLWVGTLGNSTDKFGLDLHDSINSRMHELCSSVPVWIDAEFENCYVTRCVVRALFFVLTLRVRFSGPVCTMLFRMPQGRSSFTRARPSTSVL